MTFRRGAMTLFLRSCHDQVNAKVPFCAFFLLISTCMINLTSRDGSNAFRQRINYDCWPVTHVFRLCDVITGHKSVYVNNSWQSIELKPCARCHCFCLVVTHRLICHMIYLSHSSSDTIRLDLRSNFQINLSGLKYNIYRCHPARTMVLNIFICLS